MRRSLALTGLLALAGAGVGLVASPQTAHAIEYEVFIDIDTEEELYDLYVSEQIGEDTFNTLVELRRRGVDLNDANRAQLYSLPNLTYEDVDAILAYRAEVGTIRAPADLAAAGVLTRQKLGSILTFIQANTGRSKLTATHGWVRYQTAYTIADTLAPPMVLQARVTTLRQLTVGAMGMMTRQRAGRPVWDSDRETLVAPEAQVRAHLPKAFVQWDTDRWGVIVGTYRIGFGQRLTFDSTDRYTPNGFFLDDAVFRDVDLGRTCRESTGELDESPCGGAARYTYGTKDFRWRDGQRGIAIGAKELHIPVGWLQLYGFGSWNRRQLNQYEWYDKNGGCENPLDPDDDLCSAPATLISRQGVDPDEPAAAHYSQTLPAMYDEFLGGGNFSWFYDRRTHVGVTGYGATALWLPNRELDFRRPATTPFGGSWGAVGADMNWGYRWSDLGLEVARSFDSMRSVTPDQGGGGFAGILRHTSTFGANELEVTARYYDQNYANPYAGPIAQADEYDGNRARDELGGRVRYGGRIADRLDLRGIADVWTRPSLAYLPKIQTYIRADVDANEWFRPGLWLQYRNTDLRPGMKDGCVETGELRDIIYDEDGERTYRSNCIAEVGQITGRLGFRPLKGKLSITAQYQHEFIDDPSNDEDDDGRSDYMRQDAAATLILRANPVRSFRIAARLRYLFEDIAFADQLEHSAWAYFDFSYVFAKVFLLRARYDIYAWLDQRDSTLQRTPNPEHRLRLVLEARF